jgi:acyl-CoA hydrolase
MDIASLYASKLTTPERAVANIPSGSRVSMGMAVAQPPALLKALADRAAAGAVEDLRVDYYETTRIAGDTVLRYELNDRIRPYSMFVTAVDRALVKRGLEDGGRKVLSYVPNNFHEAPRLLIEEIGIDTFLHTVSPMDRHGYFRCRVSMVIRRSCTSRRWTRSLKTMCRCWSCPPEALDPRMRRSAVRSQRWCRTGLSANGRRRAAKPRLRRTHRSQ